MSLLLNRTESKTVSFSILPVLFFSRKGVLFIHVHYCHIENERMNGWMDGCMNE